MNIVLQGLVLAAGEGSRLRPFTFSRPKHLIPLLGKPMIQYPVEDLVSAGVHNIGIVVGYFGDMLMEVLGDGSKFNVKFTYIFQERRLGIAHAIYRAIEDGFITKSFVAYLGDNIVGEGIKLHVEKFIENESDVHILLKEVKDPSQFGVAVLKDDKVTRLVEKPREHISDLAVVGVYMFRDPDLVERAFRALVPSKRGEYEITELIQWFVDNGYTVTYSKINSWWKDVGTYEGLLEAIYLLLDKIEPRVEGIIEGEVKGRVIVKKGAVVKGKVIGPCYIGSNVILERDSVIEHYVSLEDNSTIDSGRITRSLIMDHAKINIGRARLIDSVVGSYSKVNSRREIYGDLRLILSDYSLVEL